MLNSLGHGFCDNQWRTYPPNLSSNVGSISVIVSSARIATTSISLAVKSLRDSPERILPKWLYIRPGWLHSLPPPLVIETTQHQRTPLYDTLLLYLSPLCFSNPLLLLPRHFVAAMSNDIRIGAANHSIQVVDFINRCQLILMLRIRNTDEIRNIFHINFGDYNRIQTARISWPVQVNEVGF